MGDSVRDMMRQAARAKEKKAEALLAAVKKGKSKEEVSVHEHRASNPRHPHSPRSSPSPHTTTTSSWP